MPAISLLLFQTSNIQIPSNHQLSHFLPLAVCLPIRFASYFTIFALFTFFLLILWMKLFRSALIFLTVCLIENWKRQMDEARVSEQKKREWCHWYLLKKVTHKYTYPIAKCCSWISNGIKPIKKNKRKQERKQGKKHTGIIIEFDVVG